MLRPIVLVILVSLIIPAVLGEAIATREPVETPPEVVETAVAACAPLDAHLMQALVMNCQTVELFLTRYCVALALTGGDPCAYAAKPCYAIGRAAIPGQTAIFADLIKRCGETNAVPLQTAKFCNDRSCNELATGGGGVDIWWTSEIRSCGPTIPCVQAEFHVDAANGQAALPGRWTVEYGRTTRVAEGNRVYESTVATDCSWNDIGGCSDLIGTPSIAYWMLPIHAEGWYNLWWTDAFGGKHLQAYGSNCVNIYGDSSHHAPC